MNCYICIVNLQTETGSPKYLCNSQIRVAIGKSLPNSRIEPRMYVRRSIMYEKTAPC